MTVTFQIEMGGGHCMCPQNFADVSNLGKIWVFVQYAGKKGKVVQNSGRIWAKIRARPFFSFVEIFYPM